MKLSAAGKKELQNRFGSRVRFDEPLSAHTSLRIGGPADALVIPENDRELTDLMHMIMDQGIDWFLVGGGTNLLVDDKGIRGVAISLSRCFTDIRENESGRFDVGSGVRLSALCRYCLENNLAGMNFAVGIPGTVGGAVMMNAGAAGGEMAAVISSMSLLFPPDRQETLGSDQLTFSYRKFHWEKLSGGNGKQPIVLAVSFRFEKEDGDQLKSQAQDLLSRRKSTQPSGFTAGCVFKNPGSVRSAGELIDLAGLKGYTVGDAAISETHANFIINRGNASSEDVHRLMAIVQERVYLAHGIHLEPEVMIVGEKK